MPIDWEGLAVGLAVLIAWLVVRWRGWWRLPDDDRPPLAEHLHAALRAEWPLLVVLLLPTALPSLAEKSLKTLLLGLAAVLLWWIGEAVGYIGSRTTPARDPLVCSIAAVRRLGRSPWLVGVLLAVWLGSWATGVNAMQRWHAQSPWQSHSGSSSTEPAVSGASPSADWLPEPGIMTPERALRQVVEYLAHDLPRYGYALPVGAGPLLLVLAAAILFARAAFSGAPDERERAAWPFRLTVLLFIASSVPVLIWFRGNAFANLSTWPMSLWWLLLSLAFLSAAPYDALLWHVWRQVAAGERWDLKRAVDGAVRTWVPMLGLLLVLKVPTIVLVNVVNSLTSIVPSTLPAASIGFAVRSTTSSLFATLMPLFGLALAFVPWLIVDERIGVRRALIRSWALARDNASDVLAFALRYVVLYGAVDFLATWRFTGALVGYLPFDALEFLARSSVRLIGILAIGVLYQHLREAPVEAAEPQSEPELTDTP